LAFGAVLVFGAFVSSALVGCGGTENRAPTWTYISTAIIEPSCATESCHSRNVARAGVDLSDRATAYDTLVNRHFVIPGNSAISEAPALMRAKGVRRMPPDFPLPEADIKLFEAWIDMGAMNN
jgi:hypothetical protein